MTTNHGGARDGSGRKPGSKNKISKALAAQEHFRSLVIPQLDTLFNELLIIATDRSLKPEARISAATQLLDRGLGKAAQTVDLTVNDEREELSPEDLLNAWDEPMSQHEPASPGEAINDVHVS